MKSSLTWSRLQAASILCVAVMAVGLAGEEPEKSSTKKDDTEQSSPDQSELFKKFEKTLTGSKLVGHFTVVGKEESNPKKEEYTILSASKLPVGDLWLINARIKYGDQDRTIPMPLPVKWADKAPVITLDELTIPGLGTFSARVLIDNDRYAGTWSHGDVKGHLYGVIERADDTTKK